MPTQVLSSHSEIQALDITGVSTDTRSIQKGNCFFALVGPNFDGHRFVRQALEQGAACAVIQQPVELPSELAGRVLLVGDTTKALGQLAAWYRRQLKAKVIAITGSAGKTTTRNILYHILSRTMRTCQAEKSYNNHIGLPLTILSAAPQDQILLLELGTNHPGEIGYLTRIAQPDIAVVTIACAAHLEGFGTVENIIREKLSIAEGLTAGGVLLVNGDQHDLVCWTMSLNRPFLTFGTEAHCDIRAENLASKGVNGTITIDGLPIEVPLAGQGNLKNVLTAWAVCSIVGIGLSDFAEAVASLKPVCMRISVETVGSITLINDCYNANPASMANALDCLAAVAGGRRQRTVFIAGCMAELGPQTKQLHYELGQKATLSGVQQILAAGDWAADIAAGAASQGLSGQQCKIYPNVGLLCDNLHNFIHPADIVLVKGSRSAGMEKAADALKMLFETKTV